jgi:hypothetical protein
MTPPEANAMKEHVAYWTDLLGKGKAIAFGPVMDEMPRLVYASR